MNVYICDAHGAGTGEACCQHAEEAGWYEERTDASIHLDEELESKDAVVQVETATQNLGGLYA